MNENTLTLQQAIDVAMQFHSAGELQKAEGVYRKILQHHPDQPVAAHLLGVLALQTGRHEAAVELIGKALASAPDFAEAHSNLGLALQAQGKLDEAVASHRRAVAIKPGYAEGHFNLGNALHERGTLDEAVASFRKALAIMPELAEAHGNLGLVLHEKGAFADAVASYRAAIAVHPDFAEAYNNLGLAQKAQAALEDAVASFRKAVSIEPNYAEAHNNLGLALKAQGKGDEAVDSYRRAVALVPDFAEAHSNLGLALSEQGALDEAVASFEKALSVKPDLAEAYSNLGLAQKEQGKFDAAIASFHKALSIKPDVAGVHNNLGNALLEQGKRDDAIASYRAAIAIEPDYAEAHQNLSRGRTYTGDEDQIPQLLALRERADLADGDRALVNFALGKVFEDIGAYEKSFDFILEANRCRKRELQYDGRRDAVLFSEITKVFRDGAAPRLSLAEEIGPETVRPVFILGMPRSGTTLVEQIVSSHTDVHGAGELEFVGRAVDRFKLVSDPVSEKALRAFREYYLARIGGLNSGKPVVTDKMPLNFRYVGFIAAAFPDAKIVHVTRDATATCWSIFKHYFANTGNGFAYNLSDLATYYKRYVRLMAFWHATFAGRIYDLRYERLTENQESESKKLIAHLGLPWQENCLHFHRNKRSVRTASSTQVRQKMYQGSSKQWENYRPYLGELTAGLSDE